MRVAKVKKNKSAVALGILRGKKLPPERRREIARMGGKAGGRGRPKVVDKPLHWTDWHKPLSVKISMDELK